MYRVFRSFYAGGTLLRALQLEEFSEGGKSRKNEKHDRTVQISIYLHLVLVFSAAIPLTLPVAFSPSPCDHTHFFFCLAVKDLVTLMVYPFLSLSCVHVLVILALCPGKPHLDIKTSVRPRFLDLFLVHAQSSYLYLWHFVPPFILLTLPALSFFSFLLPLSDTKCPLSCSQVKTPTCHPPGVDNRGA